MQQQPLPALEVVVVEALVDLEAVAEAAQEVDFPLLLWQVLRQPLRALLKVLEYPSLHNLRHKRPLADLIAAHS